MVVAAAAMLAAFPFPPARESAAESRAHAVTHPAALPHATDLTLGSNAGTVLVGLTVRPGRPGTDQLLLYVLPTNGERAAGRLKVDLAVDGRPLGLETCGATCRKTTADLARGDEVVTVRVAGPGGGTATFRLPHLPAADATGLITETTATMNTLHTFRTDELFGPQQPPLHTTYTIEAPDRIRIHILNTGLERIRIGTTTYERATPTSPWTTETGGPSFRVPELIWDYPGVTAAHVVGSATLDGKAMTIVSFFVNVSNLPIWYRLWIDPQTNLAHRAEMRTQNHFMDHRYDAFDQPVDIVPP